MKGESDSVSKALCLRLRCQHQDCNESVFWGGPLGIAALMLFLMLILPIPGAQAHGGGLQKEGFQTDNLFRVLLPTLFIDAETEDEGLACWTGLPFDYANDCGETANDVEEQGSAALAQTRFLTDGLGGGGGTGDGGRFFTTNQAQNASEPNMTAALNVTFSSLVPFTHWIMGIHVDSNSGVASGTGVITAWMNARDANGAIIYSVPVGTLTCTAAAGLDIVGSSNTSRIMVKSVQIGIDTSGCLIETTDSLVFHLDNWAIYSVGNKADAETYTNQALEYADWIVSGTREAVSTSTHSQGLPGENLTQHTNFTILVSPGKSYLFTSGLCSLTCYDEVAGTGLHFDVWPAGYFFYPGAPGIPCGGQLGIIFRGTAIDGTQRAVNVWELNNPCSSAKVLRMGGWSVNGVKGYIFNAIHLYPVAYDQAYCYDCFAPNAFRIMGQVWTQSNAPFTTVNAEGVALVDFTGIPYSTVAYTASSCTTVNWCNFTINLDPEDFFGNAVFVAFGIANATSGPGAFCSSENGYGTMIRDGEPVEETKAQISVLNSNTGEYTAWCFWRLVDFWEDFDNGFDSYGNYLYPDNSHPAITYEISFDPADWSPNARPPNGPASNGYTLQKLVSAGNLGMNYIACYPTDTICFGNLDTENGISLSDVTYNFFTLDSADDYSVSSLVDVRITETDTGVTNVTTLCIDVPGCTIAGFAVLQAGTLDPDFVLTKDGYNTVSFGLNNVSAETINITVEMTQNASRPFSVIGCSYISGVLHCNIAPTNNSNFGCTDYNAQVLHCVAAPDSAGAIRHYELRCGFDMQGFATLQTVDYVETGTNFAFSVGPDNTPCLVRGALAVNVIDGNTTWTVSANGYRTLSFAVTDAPELVIISPFLAVGSGAASTEVNITNGTKVDVFDGSSRSFAHYFVWDPNPPSSPFPDGSGIRPPVDIAKGIRDLCSQLVGAGIDGKALCGFGILVVTFLTIVVYYAVKTGQPAGTIVPGIAAFVGFGLPAFLGLWPDWYILLFGIGVLALVYIAFKPKEKAEG